MISALAKGAQVLNEPRYSTAAEKSAQFLLNNLYDAKKKKLYRRYRNGKKHIYGMADDYAFFIQGLLDLYETTFNPAWLSWAVKLTDEQVNNFYDYKESGFFTTMVGHDKHFTYRIKDTSDNVIPSANSVSALNLMRLSLLVERNDFREKAQKTLQLFFSAMQNTPLAFSSMLSALDFFLKPPTHIIIAGDPSSAETKTMLHEIHKRYIPNKVILVKENDKTYPLIDNRATAYICVNYSCKMPATNIPDLIKLLDEL